MAKSEYGLKSLEFRAHFLLFREMSLKSGLFSLTIKNPNIALGITRITITVSKQFLLNTITKVEKCVLYILLNFLVEEINDH